MGKLKKRLASGDLLDIYVLWCKSWFFNFLLLFSKKRNNLPHLPKIAKESRCSLVLIGPFLCALATNSQLTERSC